MDMISIARQKGKKGIFFTFAAIALSIIVLFSFNALKSHDLLEDTEIVATRIYTMNNFIKDVESDLEKGLYIAGFRAFASMTEHISEEGEYIDDLKAAFNELVIDGTLEGQSYSLMVGSSFTDWTEKIEDHAAKVGVVADFTVGNVRINQTDPWEITVESDVTLVIRDTKNTSSWNRTKPITTRVNIEGLEDPLYIVKTNGRVTNSIEKTPYSSFTQGSNVDNLVLHANNSYYIAKDTSPSFLGRLTGDMSNSSYGIESLINLEELQAQGIAISQRSIVDYVYFGTQSTTHHRINNTPSWFRIDQEHLETYEVEDLTI